MKRKRKDPKKVAAGKKGGSASTAAKAEAARLNGLKGGRKSTDV